MSLDPSRRFTDREVALVLRAAAEIEEAEGSGEAGGLALEDLREIGREVGISPGSIDRAVAALDRRARTGPPLLGAPLVRKAVHAVPGELDRNAIAKLMHVVDERSDSAGALSEALGSVRWTASDRFKSSLVSITPGAAETRIQVVEKARPKIRRLLHFLPAAWAMMLATPLIGGLGLGVAAGVATAAGSAVLGAAIGRGVWGAMSHRSRTRVEELGSALAREATALTPPL